MISGIAESSCPGFASALSGCLLPATLRYAETGRRGRPRALPAKYQNPRLRGWHMVVNYEF